MKKIFFFDFDGTITNRDSFILFTFHALSITQLLSYWTKIFFSICFTSVPKSKLKEFFFINFFKNTNSKDFQLVCDNFINIYFEKIIKKSFLEYVKNIDEKSTVVIVSASIKNYLQPWCDKMGFDLICTELEIKSDRLTGKFYTPNCNYNEKLNRILSKYDLKEYDEINVFGNSSGDYKMMSLATNKYFKYFK